jgi:hypothetical protein
MRALPAVVVLCAACYHFTFEQREVPPGTPLVRHQVRVAKYVNGFVGAGRVDTRRYCEQPVRTELRVEALDVVLSIVTLLIYTPHTLYVTCEAEPEPEKEDTSRPVTDFAR